MCERMIQRHHHWGCNYAVSPGTEMTTHVHQLFGQYHITKNIQLCHKLTVKVNRQIQLERSMIRMPLAGKF